LIIEFPIKFYVGAEPDLELMQIKKFKKSSYMLIIETAAKLILINFEL